MKAAKDKETARKIREWMGAVLREKDWSARQWATAADIAPSTAQRALKDNYDFVTSSRTLSALANAAGVPLPDFGGARSGGKVELPLAYEVAASGFVPRDELPQQPYGFAEVDRLAPFRDFDQWLERVVGDSMDRIYPPGTVVHVVDAIGMHYQPKHDDCVVVERTRAGGALVERTLKQIALKPGGLEFWPRSHNTRWSAPISVLGGVPEGEDVEVRIVGLVVRGYIGLPVTTTSISEAA